MYVVSSVSPSLLNYESTGFVPSQLEVSQLPEDRPVDAQLVDSQLASGIRTLRFPSQLETYYQEDTASDRLKLMINSGLLVCLMFNWMLVSDWLLIPDQFELALRLRLFIYTPVTLVGLFVLTRIQSPSLREVLLIVHGSGAAFISIALCVASSDPYATPYVVSLSSIVMFTNSVMRMRFYQAAVLDAIILGLYVCAAFLIQDAPYELIIPGGLLLVSTIAFTLYGAYRQEQDTRINWLLHLRERLLLKDLEATNQALHDASRSDMLTDVANRRHFDEHIRTLWDAALEDGREISLLMIDVDHFKAYNDRYGHPTGDACLKEVAAALKRRLRRPGDLIARFGGEEFIAVLDGTPLKTAAGAAERVRKGIEGLNLLHATSSTHAVVTASIGVASARPADGTMSIQQLISAADDALYKAKQAGRNRVHTHGMTELEAA